MQNSNLIVPRAYFADLAAYNNGYLHGAWIECDKGPEHIEFQIHLMLQDSPVFATNCGEWAIHDTENLPGIGENEDIEHVASLGEFIAEHGEAGLAYLELFYDESLDEFEERYQGEYNSDTDFAYDYIDRTGYLDEMPDHLQCYFDYGAFARDLMMDYCEENGHYFSRH